MKQTKQSHWIIRLEGYLLIPHELLHVLGFWLVGKRCQYHWGQPYVRPLEPMARWQRLVGRLFPCVAFTLLVFVLALAAPLIYGYASQSGSWFWFILYLILLQIAILYTSSTLIDVRNAYLLIVDKPWHNHTPFDFFFRPLVDWEDVRRRAAEDNDGE